jgi:hypothetical protein
MEISNQRPTNFIASFSADSPSATYWPPRKKRRLESAMPPAASASTMVRQSCFGFYFGGVQTTFCDTFAEVSKVLSG